MAENKYHSAVLPKEVDDDTVVSNQQQYLENFPILSSACRLALALLALNRQLAVSISANLSASLTLIHRALESFKKYWAALEKHGK